MAVERVLSNLNLISFKTEEGLQNHIDELQDGDLVFTPDNSLKGNLFDFKWTDHKLNDISWLNADTFSWQSGDVYVAAYEHLFEESNGKEGVSETIAGITVWFVQADDGHKICPASEEANVQALYEKTGVAWYYIIDQANKQFKLPRTKHAFTGLRDSVGGYVEAGVPNITGSLSGTCSGANGILPTRTGCMNATGTGIMLNAGTGSAYVNNATISVDASRSSLIYGNSNTVQPPATQMYLYFYVGNFERDALEQTAGITSEQLNNKLDKSAETYLVPLGSVTAFAGTTPPSGWLKCDGSAISRTTYAALFTVIGTTYGTGDGSTTFNLPTQSVLPLGTSANVSVFGTGKALGINDGSSNGGMSTKKSDSLGWSMLVLNTNNYNQNIGYAGATTANTTQTAVGVVTDASKSGLKGTVNLANATGAKAIVCIKY